MGMSSSGRGAWGAGPAMSEDMLSVSAAIRNRLTLIRMRRVLDFGE